MRLSASTLRMARPSAAALTRKPSLVSARETRSRISRWSSTIRMCGALCMPKNIGEPRRKRFPKCVSSCYQAGA